MNGAALTVYAAIDLADGVAVRLRCGEADARRVVDRDPVGLARRLEAEGARFLHVVDLDAAFGSGDNLVVIERIAGAVRCPLQAGGGVRGAERIRRLEAAGVSRVVLGTAAVRDPALLAERLSADPERVVVAADARAGRVVIAGWTADGGDELAGFAARMRAMGVRHLLVTAVERDGTGEGPDHAVLGEALRGFGRGVIASGGVGSVGDVAALVPLARQGLAGVVVGSLLVDRGATVGGVRAAAGDA